MRFRLMWLVVIIALAFVTPGSVLGQAAEKGKAVTPSPQAKSRTMTIQGKIDHLDSMGGYFIQGQKPPELFTILNQDPAVLGELAKSGRVVTIEAKVVQGDNILIETINGKKYGKQEPASK